MVERRQKVVTDASVATKWFYPEHGSDVARSLLASIREGRVRAHAPELVFAEVASVARRHARDARNPSTAADAASAVGELARVPLNVHGLRALTLSALDVALQANCSVYDAYYIAVALQVDGVVVTADERLVASVASSLYNERVVALAGWPA